MNFDKIMYQVEGMKTETQVNKGSNKIPTKKEVNRLIAKLELCHNDVLRLIEGHDSYYCFTSIKQDKTCQELNSALKKSLNLTESLIKYSSYLPD